MDSPVLSVRDAVYLGTLLLSLTSAAFVQRGQFKSLKEKFESLKDKFMEYCAKIDKIHDVVFGNGKPGMDEVLRKLENEQIVLEHRLNSLPCSTMRFPRRSTDPETYDANPMRGCRYEQEGEAK